MIRYLLVAILISVVVTGCVLRTPQKPIAVLDPAAPCEEIVHPALLSVPFEELAQGPEQVEEWIITEFPTTTVTFSPGENSASDFEENSQFYWSEGNKDFALLIMRTAKSINQSSEQYPTLGAILRCYGDPMYYTLKPNTFLSPGTFGYTLDIYYPDRGFKFRGSTWEATVAKRYDSTSIMNGNIIITPVGTIDEMIATINSPEEQAQEIHSLLQKWPDDFTQFVLEE